jgi:DNA-binding response OmpR family regulator
MDAVYNILGEDRYYLIGHDSVRRGLKGFINRIQPDLIIIDIMAPLMTGVYIALRVHRWSSVRTLLLSLSEMDRNELRGLDVNQDIGLGATVEPDKLVRKIDNLIKRREMR